MRAPIDRCLHNGVPLSLDTTLSAYTIVQCGCCFSCSSHFSVLLTSERISNRCLRFMRRTITMLCYRKEKRSPSLNALRNRCAIHAISIQMKFLLCASFIYSYYIKQCDDGAKLFAFYRSNYRKWKDKLHKRLCEIKAFVKKQAKYILYFAIIISMIYI